jgi:hypothetical protein
MSGLLIFKLLSEYAPYQLHRFAMDLNKQGTYTAVRSWENTEPRSLQGVLNAYAYVIPIIIEKKLINFEDIINIHTACASNVGMLNTVPGKLRDGYSIAFGIIPENKYKYINNSHLPRFCNLTRADAIGACYYALSRKGSAQWIFEADIKSCFDKISHDWLRDNIPMDKEILSKWLSAGYIDQGVLHQTELGTPQGGLASPTLLVITLSGLEDTVLKAVSKRKDKAHFSIYADDFIITGASKKVLETKVKPLVESFLHGRGLELSQEKTKITHIDDGFDFLSINVRKYKGKCITKPSKKSVKLFLANIRATIKSNPTAKPENLIHLLNPKIRGWANYFRFNCAKRTFSYVDHCSGLP